MRSPACRRPVIPREPGRSLHRRGKSSLWHFYKEVSVPFQARSRGILRSGREFFSAGNNRVLRLLFSNRYSVNLRPRWPDRFFCNVRVWKRLDSRSGFLGFGLWFLFLQAKNHRLADTTHRFLSANKVRFSFERFSKRPAVC